jgi:hypothetical protein
MNSQAILIGLSVVCISVANAQEPSNVVAGIGVTTCAEFAERYRENPDSAESRYFSWATGYMTGWNVASFGQKVPVVFLTAMTEDEQKSFLRRFCDQNPQKQYFRAVSTLLGELKRKHERER